MEAGAGGGAFGVSSGREAAAVEGEGNGGGVRSWWRCALCNAGAGRVELGCGCGGVLWR